MPSEWAMEKAAGFMEQKAIFSASSWLQVPLANLIDAARVQGLEEAAQIAEGREQVLQFEKDGRAAGCWVVKNEIRERIEEVKNGQ